MKKIISLILITLLICGALRPILLMARGGQNPNTIADPDSSADPVDVPETFPPPPTTTSPSAIVLTRFAEPDPPAGIAVALGRSREELAKDLESISNFFLAYDDLGNDYAIPAGPWGLDHVDTNTPGVYSIWREPHVPEDFILAGDLVGQPYSLSVQAPGKLEINFFFAPGRGYLCFPWMLSPDQTSQLGKLQETGQDHSFADVWLRQDKKKWIQLEAGYKFFPHVFELDPQLLEKGSTYDLQIDYPGGQTGVLTFEYDHSFNIVRYSEGNRDGGDVGGNLLPEVSQPAPSPSRKPNKKPDQAPDKESIPDKEPSSEPSDPPNINDLLSSIYEWYQQAESIIPFFTPEIVPVYSQTTIPGEETDSDPLGIGSPGNEIPPVQPRSPVKADFVRPAPVVDPVTVLPEGAPPVQEFFSPEQTIISGLRLSDLCSEGESVVFGSGKLTVSFSSQQLLALNLLESDTLSVKLTQPQSKQVMLEVHACGKPVDQLLGTVLRLRYIPQSQDSEISVYNEANEAIADVSFDGEILRFKGEAPGLYTIFEDPKNIESVKSVDSIKAVTESIKADKAMSPILAFLAGLIFTTGGIAIVWRRRHE